MHTHTRTRLPAVSAARWCHWWRQRPTAPTASTGASCGRRTPSGCGRWGRRRPWLRPSSQVRSARERQGPAVLRAHMGSAAALARNAPAAARWSAPAQCAQPNCSSCRSRAAALLWQQAVYLARLTTALAAFCLPTGTDTEATLSADYGGSGSTASPVDGLYAAFGRVLTISGRTIRDEAQVRWGAAAWTMRAIIMLCHVAGRLHACCSAAACHESCLGAFSRCRPAAAPALPLPCRVLHDVLGRWSRS